MTIDPFLRSKHGESSFSPTSKLWKMGYIVLDTISASASSRSPPPLVGQRGGASLKKRELSYLATSELVP